MQLDFSLQAKRLQALGMVLSPREQAMLQAAVRVVQVQHAAASVQYFGRVGTLGASYHVFECRDVLGRTRFVVSADLVNWLELPELDDAEAAELDRLGFGLASRLPFWGRPEKRLPKQPANETDEETDEKEEEEKESDAENNETDEDNSEEDEENEEAEEDEEKQPESENVDEAQNGTDENGSKTGGDAGKQPETKPARKRAFDLREKHRLALVLKSIREQVQLVFVDAYCKREGKQMLNTQFRGLAAVGPENLVLQRDYDDYLAGRVAREALKTLRDAPNDAHYRCEFDALEGCLRVTNVHYPGLAYYVYADALVWGAYYDGDGLAW